MTSHERELVELRRLRLWLLLQLRRPEPFLRKQGEDRRAA